MGAPQVQSGAAVSWRSVNALAGLLVCGVPAVLSVPALVGVWVQFGVWSALKLGVLLVPVMWVPVLAWVAYVRRRPGRWRSVGWAVLAAAVGSVLLVSPVWFWVGPCAVVLVSEVTRLLVGSPDSAGIARRTQAPRSSRARARRVS